MRWTAAISGLALVSITGPALAAGGVRSYTWGAGLLSDDPGAHAVLPYAGGRLQGTYLFGRSSRNHFALGALIGVDADLGTVHQQYEYEETDWLFDDDTYTTTAEHTVGGRRTWVGITVGWVRDFR
jgi:hypothetical protein